MSVQDLAKRGIRELWNTAPTLWEVLWHFDGPHHTDSELARVRLGVAGDEGTDRG